MVSNNENFGSSDPKNQGFTEKVVKISRVAKVVKGGRNLSLDRKSTRLNSSHW